MAKEYHCFCWTRLVREADGLHHKCNYTWAVSIAKARINFAYQTGVYYKNIPLDEILDVTGCI